MRINWQLQMILQSCDFHANAIIAWVVLCSARVLHSRFCTAIFWGCLYCYIRMSLRHQQLHLNGPTKLIKLTAVVAFIQYKWALSLAHWGQCFHGGDSCIFVVVHVVSQWPCGNVSQAIEANCCGPTHSCRAVPLAAPRDTLSFFSFGSDSM